MARTVSPEAKRDRPIFWIKPDGSYATAVGNSGVIWQTTGTDRVLVMIDNGAIYYKVMR